MRTLLYYFWRGVVVHVVGLGLIIRDIHRFLFRRIGARILWVYWALAFIGFLLATGRLWVFIENLLILVIVLGGLWLIIAPIFRSRRRRDRQ